MNYSLLVWVYLPSLALPSKTSGQRRHTIPTTVEQGSHIGKPINVLVAVASIFPTV